MADTDAQFSEAKRTLSSLLAKAKEIRDNLNARVLTDEMYRDPDTAEEVSDRINRIRRELDWTVKNIRGTY